MIIIRGGNRRATSGRIRVGPRSQRAAEGVVKLLDFGLAKFKVATSDQTLTLATQAGTLLGTVG